MGENKERIPLRNFKAVTQFKSVYRSIKRHLVGPDGTPYPNRPFNNRANTSKRSGVHSRDFNELKKKIYAQLKHREPVVEAV